MPWSDSVDFINAQTFDPDSGFGDTFTYYPNHGEGDPVTFVAIRMNRSADEPNAAGAFEGIEIRESDFPDLPVQGDVVVISGVEYVISAPPRNPDPAGGTVTLLLNRRQRLAPGT
jgi:hypothetical protein